MLVTRGGGGDKTSKLARTVDEVGFIDGRTGGGAGCCRWGCQDRVLVARAEFVVVSLTKGLFFSEIERFAYAAAGCTRRQQEELANERAVAVVGGGW